MSEEYFTQLNEKLDLFLKKLNAYIKTIGNMENQFIKKTADNQWPMPYV